MKEVTSISLQRKGIIVSLDHIGEGYSGEYDDTDPDDKPLLRFSVARSVSREMAEEVDDASYCTLLTTSTPRKTLRKVLKYIYDEVHEKVRDGVSIKKLCESLSWMKQEDFA